MHLNRELSNEIRATVGHLPLYPKDSTQTSIDYTNAPVAYAVNVTLLHGALYRHPLGLFLPTPQTRALLVERASGDGVQFSESGISGYVDKMHDPEGLLEDDFFDPVGYTARAEPYEECRIPWEIMSTVDLYLGTRFPLHVNMALGQRFVETRFGGHGVVNVLPVIGICYGDEPPPTQRNPEELSNDNWVPLQDISHRPNLSPGYLSHTLPNALGGLGLRRQAIQRLLGLNLPC